MEESRKPQSRPNQIKSYIHSERIVRCKDAQKNISDTYPLKNKFALPGGGDGVPQHATEFPNEQPYIYTKSYIKVGTVSGGDRNIHATLGRRGPRLAYPAEQRKRERAVRLAVSTREGAITSPIRPLRKASGWRGLHESVCFAHTL